MSLSRFLNICRPVPAERTSLILTFPAEIWEGEEERDKDESVTRERKTAKQKDRKRERHISSHPHPTSRHAWMVTVWAERGAGGRGEDGGGVWGRVGSVWDGGGYVPPRPALIPSSPPSIIQQGPPPSSQTDPQGAAPQGGHNTQRRKRQRHTPIATTTSTHSANTGPKHCRRKYQNSAETHQTASRAPVTLTVKDKSGRSSNTA